MRKNNGKQNRSWPWLGIAALLCYALLLLALVWVERSDPDASIRTFGDAFWYSVVTISTVGYGDLYPVTWAGRVLGTVFVLMSAGMLTLLLGWMITVLTKQVLPQFHLLLWQNRPWYVFADSGPESVTLARNLSREDPTGVFLFPDAAALPEDFRTHCYIGGLEWVMKRRPTGAGCQIFLLGPDQTANIQAALQAQRYGCPVFFQSEMHPDGVGSRVRPFNRYECCARLFWMKQPLNASEETVLLIGSGRYAGQILERGLVMNIRAPEQHIGYHLFGHWDAFARNHPQLGLTLRVNESDPQQDQVYFHRQEWNQDPELLARADRIVICGDDDHTNLEVFRQLRLYFPVSGRVFLRSSLEIPGAACFGRDEDLFSPELVTQETLNQTAMAMHEIYRASGGSAPAWEQLSEFTRQSNISVADHLLTKIRLLLEDDGITQITADHCQKAYHRFLSVRQARGEEFRQIEHLRWMRFHSLYNWHGGHRRDNENRIHPMMVPYGELSPADQQKDDYAWELLGVLANNLTPEKKEESRR